MLLRQQFYKFVQVFELFQTAAEIYDAVDLVRADLVACHKAEFLDGLFPADRIFRVALGVLDVADFL